jgi:hypothetical protein
LSQTDFCNLMNLASHKFTIRAAFAVWLARARKLGCG